LALVDELIEIGARNDRLLEALGLRAPRVRSSAGEGLRMRAAG
jgi:hypothetical protein